MIFSLTEKRVLQLVGVIFLVWIIATPIGLGRRNAITERILKSKGIQVIFDSDSTSIGAPYLSGDEFIDLIHKYNITTVTKKLVSFNALSSGIRYFISTPEGTYMTAFIKEDI